MAVWIYTLAIKINSLALLQMLNKSLMVVGGLGTAMLDMESLPSDTIAFAKREFVHQTVREQTCIRLTVFLPAKLSDTHRHLAGLIMGSNCSTRNFLPKEHRIEGRRICEVGDGRRGIRGGIQRSGVLTGSDGGSRYRSGGSLDQMRNPYTK